MPVVKVHVTCADYASRHYVIATYIMSTNGLTNNVGRKYNSNATNVYVHGINDLLTNVRLTIFTRN